MKLIRTRRYLKDMKRLGVSETDMARLESEIVANPLAGDVVQGLGGVRKIRFGFGGRGKRGGGRAIYAIVINGSVLALLLAYAKNETSDLSPDERRRVMALLQEIEHGDGK